MVLSSISLAAAVAGLPEHSRLRAQLLALQAALRPNPKAHLSNR
jgi:hypothetical protein